VEEHHHADLQKQMGETWIATANHLSEVESQQGTVLAVLFPLPLCVAAA
jgi:hypothetical protein